jgi:hypothetical protein
MERLYARMRRVRNEQFRNNSWLLLHDNTPSHCALHVKQFLGSKWICAIQHPPFSSDLAPAEFFYSRR